MGEADTVVVCKLCYKQLKDLKMTVCPMKTLAGDRK